MAHNRPIVYKTWSATWG